MEVKVQGDEVFEPEVSTVKRKRRPNKVVYHGYSYCFPSFLAPIWKRLFCKRGWHLWDEQIPMFQAHQRMICDACGECVKIR